ncbi:DEAD/DEAH box helicase [Chromohalobacter nigrandesensis]|uniref:DEAD/DEAH box helicase n=1 Tax=Chromohalobacter nigrandesensis TaxID=119863 RepID=UPI001FF47118|nr:DEAD/DEAH box helicase [Chromohalobacter nigrandesensis]MCK0744211.1 DEAD/DEAH box helicase [Chromohalobacter nigrandesensis]
MTTTPAASSTFAELSLPSVLLSTLESLGYETPSLIQTKTIPALLEGRDVMGQAQTGTGKTAAFALPLLSRLDLQRRQPQVLVLAPTRELAQQVAASFVQYGRDLKGLEVLSLCGGQEYREQLSGLRRGAQVIVGTPGRVIDHLNRGSLKLDGLNALVLDEADEMLRMGFIDDVKRVVSETPQGAQRVFFSATLPNEISRIVDNYLVDPLRIMIETKTKTAEGIEQRLVRIEGGAKLEALSRLLEVEPVDAAIVFVRTRAACTTLVEQLLTRGVNAAALSGDLDQSLRERTVDRLKRSKVDVLIATDVAARGLDVPRITHVFNYDLPQDGEAYTHRIGRTGRAGRKGVAITFAGGREQRRVRDMERVTGQPMHEVELPDESAIRAHRDELFRERVLKTLEQGSDYQRELIEGLADDGYDPVDLACAMASMARSGEAPISRLPKPGERRPARQGGGRDEKPNRRDRGPSAGMTRYRVSVGHKDGVKPGQLVGALANEGGIDGGKIGRIDIRNAFSVVELPNTLPAAVLSRIGQARVAGRPLEIAEDRGGDQERAPRRQREDGDAPQRNRSKA